MSWVTVIWSMIASACLTLAAIYSVIWYKVRTTWAPLLFSLTAVFTTGFAFCELWLMRAQTPAELDTAMRWTHLLLFFWLVSIVWFVRSYLNAGRHWLAWIVCAMRAAPVLFNFVTGQNFNYLEVTSLRHVQFLGESVTVLGGVPNPVMLVGQFAALLAVAFVADASVTAWRRGDRRKALMVGGAIDFFLLTALGTSAVVLWANIQAPIVFSWLYLGLIAVMGYELSRDVLRASQLLRQLQATEIGLRESEARMSLAVDAADFGIWIRDLARQDIWASEKWRELFGFTSSEALEFNAILQRLHPEDRDALQQALATAVTGSNEGRYQTEYRLVLPDGAIRWISSQGRVECDAAGRPVLVRGASRDVTARKQAELLLRDLSGRLIAAQEVERARIARDLHDDVSQQLAGLSIALSGLKRRASAMPDGQDLEAEASSLQRRAATVAESVRGLSHDLHPNVLRYVGLASALTTYCKERSPSQALRVTCDAEGDFEPIGPDAALCLYRIAQEALHNIVKHANARQATVRLLCTGGTAELTIADDGKGFDVRTGSSGAGIGLVSITERARLLRGTVSIETTVNKGTMVRVRIPISDGHGAPAGPSVPVRVPDSTADGPGRPSPADTSPR